MKNRHRNRAICVKGPRLWNSQPPELNKITSLKRFLTTVKENKLHSCIAELLGMRPLNVS